MFRRLNPVSIHPPFARYAHGISVPAAAQTVFCSGQLGVRRDGTVPPNVEAQATLCFEAIAAILAEAGMGLNDLVRLNAYVTGREHLAGYMEVRDRFVSSPPPASTLMIVSGFARPEFLVEVEAIAAKLTH
jgi:enamine deaminase RidA (YjgF/YER057c/UK114 family)